MIVLTLNETTNIKQLEKEIEAHMFPAVEHFEHELAKIRTGRAHPAMVEDIKVDCYGSLMPIKELASITAPEAQMIVIQPWDKTIINDIERALALADLSATPANDGNLIRMIIQPMSSTRRQELIKTLGKKLEEGRVVVRNVRKEINTLIKAAEKSRTLSEDLSKRMQDLLQKITDKMIAKLDVLGTKKEQEISQL